MNIRTLLLSLMLGTVGAASPAVMAAKNTGEFLGMYGAVSDTASGDLGMQLIQITDERGELVAYAIPDDDVNGDGSCGRAPVTNADGTTAQIHYLDRAALSHWLKQSVSAEIHGISIGDWGIIFHAPKGWRAGDFSTQTGYFFIYTGATQSGPPISAPPEYGPSDIQKLPVKTICPDGGPR